MNALLNRAKAQAIIYTKLGQSLRVPLRSGTGCAPERQLMRWFNRQSAANPGFLVRIKSVLLLTPNQLCSRCRAVLQQFMDRYRLGTKLRVATTTSNEQAIPCVCQWSDEFDDEQGSSAALDHTLLGELLEESVVRRGAPPRRPLRRPGAPTPRRRQQPPLQIGTYDTVEGHHVHQSAAYTPPVSPGQRQPPSDQANPNHGPAVTIRQNVPGFTKEQHKQASAVQNATNQGMRKAGIDRTAGPVRVHSSGDGTLPPAPTPWVEDTKAYYSLLAAGRTPAEALAAVQRSNQQLAATGTVPLRVPR
jgi:hypothetical protein